MCFSEHRTKDILQMWTFEERNTWMKIDIKVEVDNYIFKFNVRIDRFSKIKGNLSQRTFSQKLFNRSTKNSMHK